MSIATLPLKPKDFKSDNEVRWCPGCGDYAILNQMQKVMADIGAEKHNTVFISGIGCSSRFPYYMDTYGFHTIHGRAAPIATGVKLANPDLHVWMITGDGDCLSIGAGHLVHVLRRNVNVKIVLFNNQIYGLTKGQYSPTSEFGKKSKSTPLGSIDTPVSPIAIALASQASFVARSLDVDVKHQQYVLKRAAEHRGAAFIEIYQDCNVYNHMAFEYASDRFQRPENVVYLEHGKPLIYGKDRNKGIRLTGFEPEVVDFSDSLVPGDLMVHDEHAQDAGPAFVLAHMRHHNNFPEPMGVFRAVERPCYEELAMAQCQQATEKQGPGDLDDLFNAADTWQVT